MCLAISLEWTLRGEMRLFKWGYRVFPLFYSNRDAQITRQSNSCQLIAGYWMAIHVRPRDRKVCWPIIVLPWKHTQLLGIYSIYANVAQIFSPKVWKLRKVENEILIGNEVTRSLNWDWFLLVLFHCICISVIFKSSVTSILVWYSKCFWITELSKNLEECLL